MNKSLIILLLTWGVSLSACGQMTFDEKVLSLSDKEVPILPAEELSEWLNGNNSITIIDTRSAEEYQTSHLKNAQFADFDSFDATKYSTLNPNDTIVLYCTIGYRSGKCGAQLKEKGFKNVYNLYGGILNWSNNELPLIDTQNQSTQKVHTYSKSWSKWLVKGVGVY